ncbi:hypothetical protein ACLB2K_036712 [Fragaria x ananassa]
MIELRFIHHLPGLSVEVWVHRLSDQSRNNVYRVSIFGGLYLPIWIAIVKIGTLFENQDKKPTLSFDPAHGWVRKLAHVSQTKCGIFTAIRDEVSNPHVQHQNRSREEMMSRALKVMRFNLDINVAAT